MLKEFAYSKPKSIQEAVGMLQAPGAALHAGGTDLIGCMRDGVLEVNRVVSLSGIAELKKIQPRDDGGLEIGALVTIAEIAENAVVRKSYTAFSEAAASVASPQLRAQGTLGGNLCQRPRCWYFRGDFHCLRKGGDLCYAAAGQNQYHCIFGGEGCFIVHPSDTATALVALNAQAVIAGPSGARTIPLESFFVLPAQDSTKENNLKPGEILTSVILPAPAAGMRSSYRKVRERADWDFALAGAAVALHGKGAVRDPRLVLSGVAPIPWRCADAEKVMDQRILDPAVAARAAKAAVSGAKPLEYNSYKIPMVRGLVEETLLSFIGS